MFGSSPFGQSSSSPFGAQSVFGQSNNASSNPFAPKPFGSTTPFGSQTGSSFFSSTSTGVFGNQSSSPLGSTSVFGASSTPAFGSSTPAFGASSSPPFGGSSSTFGSTSVFGQKPAFGAFGSSNAQTSPFGGSFQAQPAFGSNLFGSSTPFSSSSQSAFGTPSTSAFGSSGTPAFGATSTPAFGSTSTPAFGSTSTPAFGSTVSSPFGSTGGAFGVSTSPFGASTPGFAASSTQAFGASATPGFGGATTPFGATSTPSFSFGSAPAFGQSSPSLGSSPFGTTSSPFGTQGSPFGSLATTPTFGNSSFGQSGFGAQRGGSRVTPYSPTAEVDSGTSQAGKLESISAMPAYKDKSHEELRWEDYQLGDKGGPAAASQSPASMASGNSAFISSSTSAFGQSSANPFSSSTTSNPFAPKTPPFSASAFGASPSSAFNSSPFGASTTSNPFGSASSSTPSLFGQSIPSFGATTTPSLFSSSSSSAFGSSTSIFGSSSAQGTSPAFGTSLSFGNTQSSPLFQSVTPSLGKTNSPFGQTTSFAQSSPAFGQSSIFNTQSSGFGGNLFSSTPSLLTQSNQLTFAQTVPSLSTSFQLAQPPQGTGAFNFSGFGQAGSANTSGFGGTSNIFGQSTFGQSSVIQNPVVAQPASTNPFGTLPAMPQMSIGRTGTSPSLQYGISSLPVVDKPAPVRISSFLTSRHISQRRIKLPARKYHPKADGHMVPFFNDDEDPTCTPKADAFFVPRENPRALVIRPLEQWQPRMIEEKTIPSKLESRANDENANATKEVSAPPMNGSRTEYRDKDSFDNGFKEPLRPLKMNQTTDGAHDDHSVQKGDSYARVTGHRAGEAAAIAYEHGADIEALMPKLRHSDYYTEPRIQELAAKERAEPGYCRRVKDFVVGRHGFGSIKFIGETDIRRLDLESLIQFNNREVIVYMDESKKPPVGQGLNKPAEVTLLNIKCFDKKTGQHYTEGPRIEKYREMLRRKAEDQGAEFVSYDPVKGEWKFRVSHFSNYKLKDEDE